MTEEWRKDERLGHDSADLLRATTEHALAYLDGVADARVHPLSTPADMRAALGDVLADDGEDAGSIVDRLAALAEKGIVASAGPRYFGFVIGGAVPAALAADWLTSTWDQNATLYAMSPAAATVEALVGEWLLDLFDLPRSASVGMTTGAQMANFVGLAAGRRAVLLQKGWDVEQDGLQGAPPMRVLIGDEGHVTVSVALQYLGLGAATAERVPVDDQGRMRPDALEQVLAAGDPEAPTIVSAQVGNVNTGANDDVGRIAAAVHRLPNSWVHVDGAFGLWARVVPELRSQIAGVELADSWATDAHKWLNVPYDSGLVFVRDRDAHRGSMLMRAAYLIEGVADERDSSSFVPESSRRARGFALYAALKSLGRNGVTELVRRCNALAARMASALAAAPGVEVLNEVTLNQVLVRFGDDDGLTRDVVRRVQEDGTCWLGGSVWQGRAVMRISVSNWSTTVRDADMSVEAILRCHREAVAAQSRD